MARISGCMLGLLCITLASCGGGSATRSGGTSAGIDCTGSCTTAASFLTVAEVESVVARVVQEAQARNLVATVAVVDRVGNVLGVFSMNGADTPMLISTGTGAVGGLENIAQVPAALGAIAKAVTGAYLSSEGNAFSTRTASQIVQEHFNPGEAQKPAGPLYGVQFSQFACSDFMMAGGGGSAGPGPQRSPLGLSADPGGLPLYKQGAVVGGIGVMASTSGGLPVYGVDRNITDIDVDDEEILALAGSFGFAAPDERRADRITVGGKSLRFADAGANALASDPATADFADINGVAGAIVAVPGYSSGVIKAGTAFGQPASGVRADEQYYAGLDAFVFVDAADVNRYPPVAGEALSAAEVQSIMRSALAVANRSRAQIRIPLETPARVTISVVDADGDVLAMARTRDAPVFGADVSLQKARTAAFLSSPQAASMLASLPAAKYLDASTVSSSMQSLPADYVTAVRDFTGNANALTGDFAFSSRGAGNLGTPLFPDGIDGSPAGPFSKPAGEVSAFNIGLQLDLSYNGVVNHLAFLLGLAPADVAKNCVGRKSVLDADASVIEPDTGARLANGLQLFPGGVPVYRGSTLVGAVGVSGDGIDQDDMIAFLGLAEAEGNFSHAPAVMRNDQLEPQGVRLRYVQCPQSPYLGSTKQDVCSGK